MSEEKPLQEYLDGSDNVSASYQSISTEKPSADIDERILAAARNSVQQETSEPVKAKHINYGYYSIAASLCLSVLVVTVFLDNKPEVSEMSLQSLNDNIEVDTAGARSAEKVLLEDSVRSFRAEAVRSFSDTAESDVTTLSEAPAVFEIPAVVESGVLEEIVVVGSRTFDDYRASQESWLLEILSLQRDGELDEAEIEREAFAEVYPEIDIDLALSELQ